MRFNNAGIYKHNKLSIVQLPLTSLTIDKSAAAKSLTRDFRLNLQSNVSRIHDNSLL